MSKRKDNKKNIVLIAIMVILLVATVWYIMGSRSRKTQIFSVDSIFENGTDVPEDTTEGLPSADVFSNNLRDDIRFNKLEDYRLKTTDDKVSKENPFEPFR